MKENYCDSKVGLVGYLLYGINPEIIITSRIAYAPHGSAYGDDIISKLSKLYKKMHFNLGG